MSIDAINAIQNRISQIESAITAKTTPQIAAPQISDRPLNFNDIMKTKLQGFVSPDAAMPSADQPAGVSTNVVPLAQNNSVSCGQTSVAMCINAVTGKHLTDADINSKYGFGLLNALNSESQSAGITWKDGGTINENSWAMLEQKVNKEGLPAVVALNGPEFSPSGRGHIVTITKIEGDIVHFADPATGTERTTTKEAMNNAPSHPDGNFIFYASRNGLELPPAMSNSVNPYMFLANNMK